MAQAIIAPFHFAYNFQRLEFNLCKLLNVSKLFGRIFFKRMKLDFKIERHPKSIRTFGDY